MKGRRIGAVLTAIALAALPAGAEKIPPEFRSAFEGKVRRGASYAVVVQKGVPTTSIYGVKGDQTDAFYSVDIKGGEWQTSEGWLDLNQVAVDSLAQGEVMEVADVTFKDARIDLRMVSIEAHKVARGSGFSKSTKREPASTNFKFFFPFAVRSAQDLPQVLEYIEAWVRLFPSESAARTFSGQLLAGGAPAGPAPGRAVAPAHAAGVAPPAPAAASTTTKKEIKVGMGMLEVIDILGRPQKEVSFQSKTRWTYPDLTVIFVNGRVTQVDF
jgi:hypothetical protein